MMKGDDMTTAGHERQYARVDGDRVVRISGFLSAAPQAEGQVWLPVEYCDSQPFDDTLHYRDPPTPTAQVIGDRVVCTYQVRPKRPDELEIEASFACAKGEVL